MRSNESSDRQIVIELTKEGFALVKQDRLDEAEGRFKAALSRDAANEYALSGLGSIAKKHGDLRKAADLYACCVKAHPTNGFALYGLGDCYRGMNELQKAIETWKECLKIDPDNTVAITSIADAYRMQLDKEQARTFYDRALRLDPRNTHAIKGIGYLLHDLKLFDDAMRYWEGEFARDPRLLEDPENLVIAGNCFRRAFKHDQALRYFELAAEKGLGSFSVMFGMADCYRGLKEYSKAKKYYGIILERETDNQSILTRIGDMCVNLGEIELAKGYFERTLKIGDDVFAHLGLAHIQKLEGDFGEALKILEGTVKKFGNNQRVQAEIDQCRMQLR
jgi:tetratricopeptide (TPR) repeat protein